MHYPGYGAARARVLDMDRLALLALCRELYGLTWGDEEVGFYSDLDTLRRVALSQLDTEWTIPPQSVYHFHADAEE